MRVEEHRILAAAQGALAGSPDVAVELEVVLHTWNEAHYTRLVETLAATFALGSVSERHTKGGRYVRFTPSGTDDAVSYPNLTVHWYAPRDQKEEP